MCGLWGGMSTYLTDVERNNIRKLAMMNTTRGEDSTGACFMWKVKNKLKYHVVKLQKDAFDFLADGEVRTYFNVKDLCLVMGHDRLATLGKINVANAHPFKEGKYVGCHNGTIEKFKPDKKDEDFMTDSRLLFQKMDQKGDIEALREVGDGAYAVTYLDMSQGILNIARNFKRPLYMLWNKSNTTVYWASEKWMLDVIERGDPHNTQVPSMVDPDKVFSYSVKAARQTEVRQIARPFVETKTPHHHAKGATVPAHGVNPTGQELSKLPFLQTNQMIDNMCDSFAKLPDKTICVNPRTLVVARRVTYNKLGITQEYNTYGELVRRRIDNPIKWRAAAGFRTNKVKETAGYKGFKNVLYPINLMSDILKHGECTLCRCAVELDDEIYFHSQDEFLCADCKPREGEHLFHHTQLYKGEIVE